MAEEIHHTDGRLEHPEVHFEGTDANAMWILAILVGAAIFLAIVEIVIFQFFIGYRNHLAEVDRSPYPLAPGPSRGLPREPRLEQIERLSGDKTTSVYAREAEKLRSLNSYGPAETEGFIHIPIERAMQLMVSKKMLKARPTPPAEQRSRSEGLIDAGEPNSGRWLKGKSK